MNNTKMSGVWTPSEAPPRLDKFCHLSLDAQRVMAALYSDFHQRKAEMTAARACTSGITDPQNYYRTIYEAKFGKSLEDSYEQAQRPSMITNTSTRSVVPSHNSKLSTPFNNAFNKKSSKYFQMDVTHKPARKLIFSEGSTPCLVTNESKTNNAVSTGNVASASIYPDVINQRSAPTTEQLSPDISNYSDSPPVETQDFRLLSQMNRQEGYLHVDSVARTSNSPTVDYSTYEANNGQGLCAEDQEDSYSIKNKDWAVSEMHCEVTSPSACYSSKSDLGSKRNFSSNLDIWSVNNDIPHVGELIDSHILNDINSSLHTDFVEEEVEYPKFEILGKNEFSFSPVSSKKPSENLQKNTDIIYIEALDGLFNQNLTVSTDVSSTCNFYALDSSKVLDIEEHWMHQGMQDESPFVHEINTLNVSFQRSKTCAKKIPGFLDKMLPEMQDQHKSSNESNKSLNPRQSSSNSSECESPFVDKQVPLYPMFEKRSNGR
ncbi:hypothetical protein DPMN_165850 [Dreissena polymorpha]|uniref:Uncharacterized protein n=1 Tax=Dreissena polymorpha TaxID=45954 RepID=A0A9D4EYE5_DREPO|nr:hypothetical protein DPMN_165850 [Dreissena polymorpha]